MDKKPISRVNTLERAAAAALTRASIGSPLDLCYETANSMVESIASSLSKGPASLVVDLGKVRAMDSSGLKALLSGARLCQEAGVAFEVSAISECAARVIRMSGFGELFGLEKIASLQSDSTSPPLTSPIFGGWKTFEHVVNSDPSLIAVLREKAADVAVEAGVSDEVLCDVRIAVGEAISNAYRHGSPNKDSDKITLRCMSCPQAVVYEVLDEGQPFDPSAVPVPEPESLPPGGMGIYLMRQAMDVVEFRSNCPGNRVRMIKWLK